VVAAEATTAQIATVQVGEQAIITPVGSTVTAYGVVAAYSPLGTTSSGVTSFPVTISVTGNPAGLYPGASADVELVTRYVANVLVVPTSAVHTIGTSSYVDLLKNGKEVQQTIGIGATGSAETQVTSGLKAGQLVVIASLRASVPSGTSGGLGGGFGGRGGFGGGGFGGGGFVRAGG